VSLVVLVVVFGGDGDVGGSLISSVTDYWVGL
jgi:hypothetical protein